MEKTSKRHIPYFFLEHIHHVLVLGLGFRRPLLSRLAISNIQRPLQRAGNGRNVLEFIWTDLIVSIDVHQS